MIGGLIPLIFLAYVLYINYLPFGFEKTYVVKVGSESDTAISELYLEPSRGLSVRKIDGNGSTYRELNGAANVTFKPKVCLESSHVEAATNDPDIHIIPPIISLSSEMSRWDHAWNFTKGVPKAFASSSAFLFDDSTYFNGNTRLELPNSHNYYENGPFSILATWMPGNDQEDFQEIIGHYNWELLQNKSSVSFQVGDMDKYGGPKYSIVHPIDASFFNRIHTVLATYYPADQTNMSGYIELVVDGTFSGRTYFENEKIWPDYNANKNLSLGKSLHGIARYFKGNIYSVDITNQPVQIPAKSKISFDLTSCSVTLHVNSSKPIKLSEITLQVKK